MTQHQTQIYEYVLNIITVKMKVKFPCKMKLQHNSISLTSEISSSDAHKFIFNEEISIRQSIEKQYFEITINLLTDKGAKYIAGTMKIYHNELIRAEGERLNIALSKCLDNEAFCQLKVEQVNTSKVKKRQIFGKPIKAVDFDIHDQEIISPKNQKGRNSGYYNNNQAAETKSEFQFPVNNNHRDWDNKSRQVPLSFYQRNPSKSPNTRSNFHRSKPKATQNPNTRDRFITEMHEQFDITNRDKLIEAQVYKQGYIKLKQKFKKQAQNAKNQLNKRITLQNSQNALKLQIMRYKLRSEEQQKSITEKTIRIKQLQTQVSTIQQKDNDISYLRQDVNNKQHSIRILQDNIKQLTRENDELKLLNSNKYTIEMDKIRDLKAEIQSMKTKFEIREKQFDKQLKSKIDILTQKDMELVSKNDLLQRERKLTSQLQKTSQSKQYEFERALQNQKTNLKSKIDELKEKAQKLQRNLSTIEGQKKQLHKQNQHYRTQIMKLQYDKRIIIQQNDAFRTQIMQMKSFKDKYNELYKQHKFIIEEKNYLQKQLDKTVHSKEINMTQMNRQFQDQIDYYKRINRQLDDRAKNYSNKIIQMEGQMQITKSQSEKVRRNNQNLIKDLAEAKEKEKQAKKALKTKEQQMLSLEAQYSTIRQKSKNIDQIHKLEEDKLKDQVQKLKNDLENEYLKCNQISESNTQFAMELSKMKIKLQFTEERLQKDGTNLRDRQGQLQNLIRDYQSQIDSLQESLNTARQAQKQLTNRLQKLEIDIIKSQEQVEKKSKHLKIMEQKYLSVENLCRNKQNQINNMQYSQQETEKKVNQLQADLIKLRMENQSINNQKNKFIKINQMYEQDIKKLKTQLSGKSQVLSQKQKQYEQIRIQCKTLNQQILKADMKYNNLKKQTDRFRDSLTECLNSSFIPILNPYVNIGDRNQSQSSQNINIKVPLNDISITKRILNDSTTNTEIISLLISHSKDAKLLLSRFSEQNRHLQKEIERLSQEASQTVNKHQTSQYQLHKTIQQLEEQISRILSEKQDDNIKNDHVIAQLSNQLKDREHSINDLNQQIQELQFTLNSLKMDYDSAVETSSKKLLQFKQQINELEERIEDVSGTNMELEDNVIKLQNQLQFKINQFQAEKEMNMKKNLQIEQLKDLTAKYQQQLTNFKSNKKELLQKISELELHLTTQLQLKSKAQNLLTDEQAKSVELKTFISNLMKQKEAAIKSEIQKSQQLIVLETSNIQLQRDKQIVEEQNGRLKKLYEENKQQVKILSSKIKDIESEYGQETFTKHKLSEKLKQKQKQIISLTETIKKLEMKHQKYVQKAKNQINQLQSQIEERSYQAGQNSKETNQKILAYQKKIHEKDAKILSSQNKLAEFQQQLFSLNQFNEKAKQQISTKQTQILELQTQLEKMQNIHSDLLEEIKEKEENMFQLSGKMYNLQLKIQAQQVEKNERMGNLDSQWIEKYENVCEQYEQRLQLIQKERQYYKGMINEKDEEIRKLRSDNKNSQIEDSHIRRTLQEKIKKLEEDRLSLFTLKNNEIQKLSEENKSQFETMKVKESQLRRIANQLDIARATITSLDQKAKQSQDKIKSINKIYTTELQQLKKKQASYKNYKEWIVNQHWSMERDVRKVVQSFVKKFIENSEQRSSSKIVEIVKGLQGTIIEAISSRIDER